ncbi:MAG TPA: putative peptidoglycan glycosyltransferase FtsW [Candidatus Paceibacterota bacterium]|nr:putative peptidoglycan glycosyltransferase FtsW [Candidatus Paceibacterota bacterium]HRZ34558.1 putative peptidoglycan glycosyltransferase FtsW [Candidatus Paceibacterota bacterium]
MWKESPVDKVLLIIIISLVTAGIVIYLSATLGLLAGDSQEYLSKILNQFTFGLISGGIICYLTSKVPYKFWRNYSFWIFLLSLLLTAAVFLPKIGLEVAGAKRWLIAGPLTFQPGELLKIAYVIYVAAWLSAAKEKIKSFRHGTLPFLIISALAFGILLLQPDNDTMLVMLAAGGAMYLVAGANLKHVILVLICGALMTTAIVFNNDYVRARLATFINPAGNPLTSGYQLQQSLIAIGSGGLAGRGFGKSIQKFDFLPEPTGDSIFAVIGEEFGFVGCVTLVLLFIALLTISVKISLSSKETFGGLLILGLGILIVSQSFINMASMLGIFPLAGLPLLFISHGGTALLFTLFASGIMLNISRFKQTN